MTENFKKRFKEAVAKTINRDGIDNLMEWIEGETDFFESPASTRYHGSYEGGLVEHSLNVFNQLLFELDTLVGPAWQDDLFSMESVAIVALFHDLCKANQYQEVEKWRKDADGQWESYLAYEYNDESLAMGHGAKSNFLLQQFIQLTAVEAQAIFWHMGAYDISPYANLNGLSKAFENNQLAFLLHRADMASTYAVENENFQYARGEVSDAEVDEPEEAVEEVVEETKPEPKPGITRRKKAAPKEEPNPEPYEEVEKEAEEKPKSKIRMPKKSKPVPAEPEEEEAAEEHDNIVARAGQENKTYFFYNEEADAYYKKDVNEPDDDNDILVDEEEYLDAMCPVLEEDFFYLLNHKAHKLAAGKRLPEEYDEETWEPITEQEYIKRTEKPKAVAKPTRKKPTPSRRPYP